MPLLSLPIRRSQKTLNCVHCSKPVPVDAQATRCVCSDCIAAGRSLPREHQEELAMAPAT